MKDIYINSNLNSLTKFTSSSSRNTEFKGILSWNISQHENIHKPREEMGILFEFIGKPKETETIT